MQCRRPGELAAHLSDLLDGAGVREVRVKEATLEDAYLKLRNESRRLRRPMRELAEAVILADELEKQRTVPSKPTPQ